MPNPAPPMIGRHRQRYGELRRKVQEIDTDPGAPPRNLARTDIRRARVSCCLKASDTKWGKQADHNVAIFFLEIVMYQPPGYLLKDLTLQIKFLEQDPDRAGSRSRRRARLWLINNPSPTHVTGTPRNQHHTRGYSIEPGGGAGAISFSLGRFGHERSMERARSWIFRSNRDLDEHDNYTGASWIWESNKYNPQVDGPGPLQAALVVRHPSQPFFVTCTVEGNLRKNYSILRLFRRNHQEPAEIRMILPVVNDRDLSQDIDTLEDKITRLNLEFDRREYRKSPEWVLR
ncbi:uncharacterized protein HMPREF1541_09292 [Cyphellophora europaea CBS 101466]|uniref:Uncharacterized protein n=1 Tax=Cyphellophora europaea (strain CBS 101466) TaxID=1220924 RepID=W2SA08_CYPE1|nr:uncharacterized protein HMPREF1541_09292 [Cyphellophora europaea CBS 101466]ETN45460.1 hypothetical protein HMPREF1541_09292 [Cyphellophora europaea CBS 101466]